VARETRPSASSEGATGCGGEGEAREEARGAGEEGARKKTRVESVPKK
jgi:hypothetical protein